MRPRVLLIESGESWVYSFPGIKCCYHEKRVGMRPPGVRESPADGPMCSQNNPRKFRCQSLTSTARMPVFCQQKEITDFANQERACGRVVDVFFSDGPSRV